MRNIELHTHALLAVQPTSARSRRRQQLEKKNSAPPSLPPPQAAGDVTGAPLQQSKDTMCRAESLDSATPRPLPPTPPSSSSSKQLAATSKRKPLNKKRKIDKDARKGDGSREESLTRGEEGTSDLKPRPSQGTPVNTVLAYKSVKAQASSGQPMSIHADLTESIGSSQSGARRRSSTGSKLANEQKQQAVVARNKSLPTIYRTMHGLSASGEATAKLTAADGLHVSLRHLMSGELGSGNTTDDSVGSEAEDEG